MSKAYKYKNIGQMFLLYSVKDNKYYHFGIDTQQMGRYKEDCYFDPVQKTIHSGGSVLIYMSKNKVANYSFLKEYDRYVKMCPDIKDDLVDGIIEELKQYTGGTTTDNSDFYSQFISLLRKGIVIHHGSMPLRTRAMVEKFVNNHLCRLCFSTSTLEQGINMPFDVVVLDRFENSKPLAIKNLIGRAGRSSDDDVFDVGFVVVTSPSNMSNLRQILLSDNLIKGRSSLDIHDALDDDFHDYKEAINNGTMDDRFNLPPVIINRLVEGDGSDEIRAVLEIVFDANGQLISREVYQQRKASPRLRCNLDMRNSAEDQSQRMLNALEPGTVMPIHRHRASSETVVVIRGKIRWIFYDENGNETERVLLDANGENRMLVVEKNRWHSLECLESESVLFESKDGAYEPLGEEDILTK